MKNFKCPICRAAISQIVCGRCNSDLSALLAILLQSHKLREDGRNAILGGRYNDARAALEASLKIEESATARRRLRLIDIFESNNPAKVFPSPGP